MLLALASHFAFYIISGNIVLNVLRKNKKRK